MNKTQQYFLNILKASLRGESFVPAEDIPGEAWEQIMKLAGEHQVLPMVYEAACGLPGFAYHLIQQ